MFEIKILDQYWIDKETNNQTDLCSHGSLFIKFNDTIIADENDGDWTISTTALQLLRAVENNHEVNTHYPMVQHCGQLEFLGCPISIDWESIYQGDVIKISKVLKLNDTDEKNTIHFTGLEMIIDKKAYIKEVIDFTENVIVYFEGHNPPLEDDYDRNNYNSFWKELNHLYYKYKRK